MSDSVELSLMIASEHLKNAKIAMDNTNGVDEAIDIVEWELEKEQRDFEWADDVIMVDERSLPCVTQRPCEECDALETHATMAETEEDGFGPSWVCTECGGVERI